ncbi:hypothetical protein [Neorhizobium alkalisoli]|uniref:Uncharacterized protein n=1 Tax=Neorhizobium alkalisoli TaxID=528178 RepID=A0A561QAX4_9HYPH|nr:hypothetical protein [Neorhizobium alkalisoli]TWF47513.1 hypothetical protein FHW37_11113 [Neorhizobium alkalisoli]
MKQPKRNFVIEYKSGRRRSVNAQSSSIWGNLDLKSVAQAVETDMPKPVIGIDGAVDSPSSRSARDIVAEANAPPSVASPADGDDAVAGVAPGTLVENDALVDSEETIVANDAIGSAEGDATGEAARSEPGGSERIRRRVRKTNARRERQPVKPKSARTKLVSMSEADKELADLFQLEEENRQLRRLLVVKLRKDNDWLRDRLRSA